MVNNLAVKSNDGILRVNIPDAIEEEDVKKIFSSILEEAVKLKSKSILLDLTESELQLSFTQIYMIPSSIVNVGFSWSYRLAVLVDQFRPKYSFLETVFRNQGFSVKVFFDDSQAYCWLNERK